MSLAEIKSAVDQLSPNEFAELIAFLRERDSAAWDRELEADIAAGRLDSVLREVDDDIRAGRVSELPLPAKEIALEVIQKLPADSTFDDICERIEFIAGVRKGLDEIKQGQVVPLDEVEKNIDKWATK